MSTGALLGRRGEDSVCAYLEKSGYTILARNFRVRGGEADIIAKKDGTVVFAEVKTRTVGSLSDGIDAINDIKCARIIRAAERFIEKYNDDYSGIRFDAAILSATRSDDPDIIGLRYIENAFDA